ncbi:MAG: hypothetical protein M1819_005734 [Sarea resinae]|nr:MAG: hypothetical protein M1819_005734 [Sarea resinae]
MATTTTTSRQQPPWQPPPQSAPGVSIPPLKVFNSLTRSKTPFVPLDPAGKKVSWYVCGPTVYDDAHLGHARNYVTTDILRRIMRDYFKFEVNFVMNITDVDDKIIVRGRQQYLLEQFTSKHTALDEEVAHTASEAYAVYIKKNLPLIPVTTPPEQYTAEAGKAYAAVLSGGTLTGEGSAGDAEAKIKMHLKTATDASQALVAAAQTPPSITPADFFTQTTDVLLPYLDSLYGSSIDATDHAIFTKLTRKFENRFMEDVRALNCLDPDVVTRVTEYGPQIVSFVSKIVANGFGYATADGSIYFDIQAFERAGNSYARLEPWNRNDAALQADGEGALTKTSADKRSSADFALWKSSKPGEPSWPSPWGPGRPGWHIECSAMASDVLGSRIDIHSGGIDLAFPHHDNELAQSEAYWSADASHAACCSNGHGHGHGHEHQWVDYFMHMGHLSIAGSKMSKSLKNFTTIREALGRGDWTPRGLRIVFLLGGWKDGVEITDDLVVAGSSWEDKVNNFFIKAKDALENAPSSSSPSTEPPTPTESDTAILSALATTQQNIHAALCDSFNTPIAMSLLSELITKYNTAVQTPSAISVSTTRAVASWITQMVNIFGLESNPSSSPSSSSATDANTIGWSGIDVPEDAKPYLIPLAAIRDSIRVLARSSPKNEPIAPTTIESILSSSPVPANDPPQQSPYHAALLTFRDTLRTLPTPILPATLLKLSDELRDETLWALHIYLEDRDPPTPSLIRPLTKDLIAARAEKTAREEAKVAAKAQRDKEAREREEKARVDPREMFRSAEWSAWDADGVPVADAAGVEVPKSKSKKLRKEWERQKKSYDAWLATEAGKLSLGSGDR